MQRLFVIGIILFLTNGILYSQNTRILPTPVNDIDFNTIAPYISYDGKNLVFLSERNSKRLLVESELNQDQTWSHPEVIDIRPNDSLTYIIEAPVYNQDASQIYFSLKFEGKKSNSDIYYIEKKSNTWSEPIKFDSLINTVADETDPFLSPDGKFFYFARRIVNEDLKKFECYQIFISEKINEGWSKPLPLPEPINAGCDKSPRLAADGKTLYFTSIRNGGETGQDIYYAKKITKNAWMSPIPIDTINTSEDESYPSIPLSGEQIYFQLSNKKGKNLTDKLVKANITSEFQPEKAIHIYGFVSDLKTNKPVSAEIDIIDPNTSIVLFSVKTNELNGSYSFFLQKGQKYRIDVYNENYSHYFFYYNTIQLREFTEEQKNIKLYSEIDLVLNVYDSEIFEPLNSAITIIDLADQTKKEVQIKQTSTGQYYITLPIGKQFQIEANKKHYETNRFNLDLRGAVQFSEFERDIELQIKKIDYEIQLSDSETGEGVETEIEITNLSTNEKIIKKVKTDKDGKLKIKLREGTLYEINVSPKGYAFYNITVDLMEDEAEYSLKADLKKLKKATKIELNDINFETNSADLNKSSYEELDRVVKLLQTNPQIKIEVSAHTDDVGSVNYNLKLSDKRAKSVLDYLLDNEIKKEQIVSKGYGKSKPAYLPVNTEENRAKNRRVELEVVDINLE